MTHVREPALHPCYDGTEIEIERARLEAGEPNVRCDIAGLQFYEYGRNDDMEGVVMPKVGQPLSLVRRPENASDVNAVEIWLGNSSRIGHVP